MPGDPILRDYGNIRQGDAVLTWDGYPLPKIVDGRETFPNARRPVWPEAEFIVGNPPFLAARTFAAIWAMPIPRRCGKCMAT